MPDPNSNATFRAPELPSDCDWFNTAHPLSWPQLRGALTVVVFWRIGCQRSLQLLDQLRPRATLLGPRPVVIGVHSAKFPFEQDSTNVRRALLRLSIEIPVVCATPERIQGLWGVTGQPAICLVDPEGMVGARLGGDEVWERASAAINEALARSEADGTPPAPFRATPERAFASADSPLGRHLPTNVLVDPSGGRIFVADSGRQQILEADLESGVVRRTIGSGTSGLIDGPFHRARFRDPQGLALRGDLLFVADTGNHLLREVDLGQEIVRTLAGTGEAATAGGSFGTRWPARRVALSSPWGLALAGNTLYTSMAGCDQIWRCDLELEELAVHAGQGKTGHRDGPHAEARLGSPRGMTSDGKALYFVDAESSTVRRAGLGSDGEVLTLAGQGLFDFGWEDAIGAAARLQHPLGICRQEETLFVADTFNRAVRTIHLATREVRTLTGRVTEGAEEARVSEPMGLSAAGGFLYVADPGRRRVVRFRLSDGQPTDWELSATDGPAASAHDGSAAVEETPEDSELVLEPIALATGATHLHFDVRPPAGYRLNRTAPLELTAYGDGNVVEVPGGPFQLRTGDPSFPISIPLELRVGIGFLRLVLVVYYCEAPEMRLCYYQTLQLRVPVRVMEIGGKPEARVIFRLEVPSIPF